MDLVRIIPRLGWIRGHLEGVPQPEFLELEGNDRKKLLPSIYV